MKQVYRTLQIILLFLAYVFASACANGSRVVHFNDPAESVNRDIFAFNEFVDQGLVGPVAKGYKGTIPSPVRARVTHFFDNVAYLSVILNDFLQGKIYQGTQDSLRFIYNSSIGIGGLYDVATGWGLPKNNEDFGQTLAKWGVKQGPYLVLPFFGPSTMRVTPHLVMRTFTTPLFYTPLAISLPLGLLGLVNTRANFIAELELLDEMALDKYAFTREAYLQRRRFMIHDGNIPEALLEEQDFFLEGYEDEEW